MTTQTTKQFTSNAKGAALYVINQNRVKDGFEPLPRISKLWWELNGKGAMVAPAAACPQCGGWHGSGGMAQFRDSKVPVFGRVGCVCFK